MKLGKLNAAIRKANPVYVMVDTPHGPVKVKAQKGDLISQLSATYGNKGEETGLKFDGELLSYEASHDPAPFADDGDDIDDMLADEPVTAPEDDLDDMLG